MIEIMTTFYHSDKMEHVKMLMNTWFNSIFQESNVPQIMKAEDVVHNIYCSSLDVAYLEKNYLPLAESKKLRVTINDSIITSDTQPRSQLYLAIQDQMRLSIKNNSIMIFAAADQIFGNGLSLMVDKYRKSGMSYFVCPVIRISFEKGYDFVCEFLKRPHLDNSDFVRLFIEDVPHRMVELAINESPDYMRLKKIECGWNMFHKEPSPLMCRATGEMLNEGFMNPFWSQFECVDHDIPNMYYKQNKLMWVSGSDEFIWGEFTSDDKYQKAIDNNYWSDAAKFFHDFPVYQRTK